MGYGGFIPSHCQTAVVLIGFLLGLLCGLIPLVWLTVRIQHKLRRMTQSFAPEVTRWSLAPTAQLMRAIALQQEQQHKLEREVDLWRQVCHVSPIGFLQIDEDNQLIRCSPRACELLSLAHCNFPKPRLLLEIVRSYELDEVIDKTRASQQPRCGEWTYHPVSSDPAQLSRQQPRPLRASTYPLLDGTIGVFLEDRLEASSLAQQRDRWISDVAHELKTPLTSIRLVAETLEMRLDPPLRGWVTRLLRETIRLGGLVQDLLELNHLAASPTDQLHLNWLDLPALLQIAWSSLEPLARRKSLQLEYAGSDHLLIWADEARLHRVLLNLLDNSIKYSPNHSTIQVKIYLQPNSDPRTEICLDVIDAGCGFSERALPHVFDRFYRADFSRTRRTDHLSDTETFTDPLLLTSSSSGLGLAIVRQIVEAHKGYVTARNHPETQGAWLQVVLPYHPKEPDLRSPGD